LQANIVYVRRGSSTDLAQPDELARMGAADASSSDGQQPTLELEWADLSTQSGLGASVAVQSLVLNPQLSPKALMPRDDMFGLALAGPFNAPGESYYADLLTYVYETQLISPLGLCIRNTGDVAARNVVLTSRIEKASNVRFYDASERPVAPSKHPYMAALAGMRPLSEHLQKRPRPRVTEFPTHWELTVPFGNVLPKASVWSTDVIYVGSESSIDLAVPVRVYAENLANPLSPQLVISVSSERRPMTRADIDTPSDE
jgi:hypothetical protein